VRRWAREAIFFPFDSAASYYNQCRFLEPRINGHFPGSTLRNALERDHRNDSTLEQVYDTSTTLPAATVAEHIAFAYDPAYHVRRWKNGPWDDSVHNTSEFFSRNDLDISVDHRTMYIVATGHLFDEDHGGRPYLTGQNDTLLAIDVVNEIPSATTYLNQYGQTVTAGADTTFVYATGFVTKQDLLPPVSGVDTAWSKYRAVPLLFDMKRADPNGHGGPFNDANSAHRMDIRVRWTGKEKLALRSIALRDTAAQLLLGDGAEAAAYRAAIRDSVERVLRGYTWNDPQDTAATNARLIDRLGKMIRIYTGDEGGGLRNVGFNWLDSVLYRRYGGGDSLTRGFRSYRAQAGTMETDASTMTSQNEITMETYPWDFWWAKGDWSDSLLDARPPISLQGWTGLEMSVRYGIPDSIVQPPTLIEHNGGRFYIPVLALDSGVAQQNVDMYSRFMQRANYGAYIPGHSIWPYEKSAINKLGRAAALARRTGRRLIQWPGVHVGMHLWNHARDGSDYRDTILSHLPEAAEVRVQVNLGLCYGARGVEYSYLGANDNEYDTSYNFYTDFGPVGPTTTDTDNVRTLYLHTPSYRNPPRADTIPNVYTGWGNRLREIRWINRWWIPRQWEYVKNLRWRDGYSTHFTVPQTYNPDSTRQMNSRPLHTGDIVRSIRTYDRYGHLDSLIETYVELGLFDPHAGQNGYDTAFCYLVNRRTFERPSDVDSTTARGKLMDSLAEVRRLVVALNFHHPDTTHGYGWYRVVELAPDTTPLPQIFPTAPVARKGLDTLVFGDSSIAVTLRPGGGALLKIFPVAPDQTIDSGSLKYPNAHRICFDGSRYHAVAVHYDQGNDCSSVHDTIIYRRSFPVDANNNAILWEAPGYMISEYQTPGDTGLITQGETGLTRNRAPAITYRAVNGDTVISIVWSAHKDWDDSGRTRQWIVERTFEPTVAGPQFGAMEIVDTIYGDFCWQFGTPGICRLEGGDAYVYSDSLLGIIARLRVRPGGAAWWLTSPGSYTNRDTLTKYLTWFDTTLGTPARSFLPTIPSASNIRALDSNVGVAFQQFISTQAGKSDIIYQRLWHIADSTGDHLVHVDSLRIKLNTAAGYHTHPCMDLWQDVWWHAYEAVVWEQRVETELSFIHNLIWFQPLATRAESYDANAWGNWTVHWDHIDSTTTYQWTKLSIDARVNQWEWQQWVRLAYDAWPTIAALNEVIDSVTQWDTAHFALAWVDTNEAVDYPLPPGVDTAIHDMVQAHVYFGESELVPGYPHKYLYDGYWPNQAVSQTRQDLRSGILYNNADPKNRQNRVFTSRQFFGKTRPRGYLAHGRQTHFVLDPATSTVITVGIGDVWYASDTLGAGVRLVARGPASRMVDSLDLARSLLGTTTFATYDSTAIGLNVFGTFSGDSALAPSARVAARAELVDSATGTVVALLDSFVVDAAHLTHNVTIDTTLDLLSGTYSVRLVLDTTNIPVAPARAGSRFPTDELMQWVDDVESLGKIRRLAAAAGPQARLDVRPNPARDAIEILFSVPLDGDVTLAMYDARGVQRRCPIRGEVIERGRYAIRVETADLMPGTYFVDLRMARERVVRTIVLVQ